MLQRFSPGDFLIFQLESGFGLLRVLDVDESAGDAVWHLAAYRDLFFDTDAAEAAIENAGSLTVEISHLALTERAFESTQVAKLGNAALSDLERGELQKWKSAPDAEISDRSVRLMLGLR